MLIEKKENYTLISSDENSFPEFQEAIASKLKEFKNKDLVLKISDTITVSNEEILLFLKLVPQIENNGTSFAMINSIINPDDFPENINIVPTLQEAEDILEMEAIERALGF